MSANEARRYRLTPHVIGDLEGIWRYTAQIWSTEQADRCIDDIVHMFQTLADFPTLARERTEFSPPVRIQVFESHLIIYRVIDAAVVVLRVLGGQQDWTAILHAAD